MVAIHRIVAAAQIDNSIRKVSSMCTPHGLLSPQQRRAVSPFLQGSRFCPTDRHAERQTCHDNPSVPVSRIYALLPGADPGTGGKGMITPLFPLLSVPRHPFSALPAKRHPP